jgi:hypothetical protein
MIGLAFSMSTFPAKGDPHALQNWLPGGFSFPHLGQTSGKGFPQPLQNFAPSGFSDWQDGHFMVSELASGFDFPCQQAFPSRKQKSTVILG